MKNKLELIKELRMEIREITVAKNEIGDDYNRYNIEIKEISDEINRLNVIWCGNREKFERECQKKIGLRILPVYVIMTLILGYAFGKAISIELGLGITNYVISYGLIGAILSSSYFISIDTPNIYHNYKNKRKQGIVNRRRNYLFKKYPHIEKIYNDLMSTLEQLISKEEHLDELKSERKSLEVKFQEICNLLNNKEQELSKLEKECIDMIFNNITNENTTTATKEKGKTRVRRKEDN